MEAGDLKGQSAAVMDATVCCAEAIKAETELALAEALIAACPVTVEYSCPMPQLPDICFKTETRFIA